MVINCFLAHFEKIEKEKEKKTFVYSTKYVLMSDRTKLISEKDHVRKGKEKSIMDRSDGRKNIFF